MAASDYIKAIKEARAIMDTMGIQELSTQHMMIVEQLTDPTRQYTARERMRLECRRKVFAATLNAEAETI